MKRDYETLDAVVVVGCMVMVSGMLVGFFTVKLEDSITPVLSSLATAILGVPIAYGAFRWGNNVGAKHAAEAAAETSRTATGALAQLAGANAPLPTAPPADPSAARD
ncbi:hypothetical protein [Caulobacter sp. UNC279MFTsu5.1]|uniref:hypothetical protein n=1 Tax=Caulobacter sp. UNC279MFTsu5.1 TaxID=1502775 RepID=UPI0008E5F411|nr:hypothetical protein [Caulobacter sp. UNC279MFTsu5.1]SFK41279.1 hypothetical protein SAMN02799626_04221 [Caulobacter sp. UNC279MFTsu5.1]